MSESMDSATLYQQLVAINNAEQATYWTRYNIQAVINTAAFSGYAAVKVADPPVQVKGCGTR